MTKPTKAPKTEVQKLLPALRAEPALSSFATGFDRLADLWRACPNVLWLFALLQAAHYVPDARLRRVGCGAARGLAKHFCDARTAAALSTVNAYLAGKADGFDRRDAWAKALSAAHVLRMDRATPEVVATAFAVAHLAAPDAQLLPAVRGAFARMAKARPARLEVRWLQSQADVLRKAIGNPFEDNPHLALTLREKQRMVQKVNTRAGERRLCLRGALGNWEVVYHPLEAESAVTVRAGSYAQALGLAYEVALREFAPLLTKRPARRRSTSVA